MVALNWQSNDKLVDKYGDISLAKPYVQRTPNKTISSEALMEEPYFIEMYGRGSDAQDICDSYEKLERK